jgi:hypothetical protein
VNDRDRGRRGPSRAGTLDGLGDHPFDRYNPSSLGAEPFLQALQVELEVVTDEFTVWGRQNEAELVGRHLLIPKNHLRPGETPQPVRSFGIESVVDAGTIT